MANYGNFLAANLGRGSWFTSLWTLQEAFLCPQAIFLSKNARVIPHSARNPAVVTLRDLLLICEAVQRAADRYSAKEADDEMAKAIRHEKGVLGLGLAWTARIVHNAFNPIIGK